MDVLIPNIVQNKIEIPKAPSIGYYTIYSAPTTQPTML